MITFDHLSVQNFRSWKRVQVPLDKRGVVCVQGDTGAGKSSLFAALFWGLYGMTPDPVRADEVRREGARKPTIVRIRLTKDGHRYTIVRFRGSKEFKNKVLFTGYGIPNVVEDSHVKTVQGLIDQFLGVPPQTFLATTYFAQRNFHFFHTLTDQAKKAFLESLTYGSLFEACEAESRKQARAEETRISFLEGKIRGLEDSLKVVAERSKEERQRLSDEIGTLETQLATLSDAINLLQAQLLRDDTLERFGKVEIRLDEVNDEMAQVLHDLKRYETNKQPCPRCGLIMPEHLVAERMHDLSERYKKLGTTLERVSEQRSRLAPALAKVQAARADLTAKDQEAQALRVEIRLRQQALKDVSVPPGLYDELAALRLELTACERDHAYTAFWVKGFGFSGLRSFVLQGAITYLAAQVERYLKRIMGERIEFTMVIEQTRLLTECNGRSYAALSGGERQAVDLCTGLAMRDLAQRYAKSRFNLLILDEPHEGLDKQLTAVAQGLLLDYQMPSTFLITHQDYAGHFDQLCAVSRHKAGSVLRVLY